MRVIRTCRRMYNAAKHLERDSRIFCHSSLVAFAYFDVKKKKVMFDVSKRKEKSLLAKAKDRLREECDYESRFEYRYPRLRRFIPADSPREREEKEHLFLEFPPRSHLLLRKSDRERAFYRKMTAEQLGDALKFFRFETVDIVSYSMTTKAGEKL